MGEEVGRCSCSWRVSICWLTLILPLYMMSSDQAEEEILCTCEKALSGGDADDKLRTGFPATSSTLLGYCKRRASERAQRMKGKKVCIAKEWREAERPTPESAGTKDSFSWPASRSQEHWETIMIYPSRSRCIDNACGNKVSVALHKHWTNPQSYCLSGIELPG